MPTQEELAADYTPPVRRWLPAVALALAMLYALAVNGHWAVRPDSGVYLELGRSLAEGRGMEFRGRQMWGTAPLVPALVAGCRLLEQSDGMWLLNLVMSAFGVGTALAALGIANRASAGLVESTRMVLAIGTFLVVGTSAKLFGDSTHILTDIPFAFFFSASLYCFLRSRQGNWGWCLVGGVALLAGALTRPVVAVLAPPIALAMLLDRRPKGYGKRLAATALAMAIAAAGFLYWMLVLRARSDPASADYFRAFEGGSLSVLSAAPWARMLAEVLRFPLAVAGVCTDQKLPWLNLVPTALVLVGLAVAAHRRVWLVVLPVLFYLAFLVMWGGGAMASRYLLPLLPPLAYCLLLGAQRVGQRLAGPARDGAAGVVSGAVGLMAIAALCLLISLPKDFRTIYWARHENFYKVYDHGKWRGTVEASQVLRRRGRPGTDVVVTAQGSVVHYLSGLAVETGPTWPREGPGLGRRPPKEFAETAAGTGHRFILVPLDQQEWAGPTLKALEETGAFRPAEICHNVALVERW